MARDLTNVIDQLLGVIPETERNLRVGLESIQRSIAYTPPGSVYMRWQQVHELLDDYAADEDYTDELARIWNDK